MNRRRFLTGSAAFGAAMAGGQPGFARADERTSVSKLSNEKGIVVTTTKLTPPAKGRIPVAVAVSEGATVIDFAGPWDVFVSVMMPGRGKTMEDQMPFELFLVSDTLEPVTVEGGMEVVPRYTFANVPACKVVVVGAQRGSQEMQKWLGKVAITADALMSVCTGVNHLARAGLLNGKAATIHHDFYDRFARENPEIDLRRGVRFVENGKISTSGGETCGIDLSLRIVERYFGRQVAQATAEYIEHQGKGWMV